MCVIVLQHLLRVIPVIGILRDKNKFNPIPNPGEVEAVFDAPLEMFLKVALVFLPSYFSCSCVFSLLKHHYLNLFFFVSG